MHLKMKQIRVGLGLGQKDVAEKLGMPVRRYGSYERGERTLSLEDAARIADVFDCSLDELAGRDWRQASDYADPRQAELNRCWESLDPERQDRILTIAHDMEAAKSLRGDAVSSQADVG